MLNRGYHTERQETVEQMMQVTTVLMLIKCNNPVAGEKDLFLINYPGFEPPTKKKQPVKCLWSCSTTGRWCIPAYSAQLGAWVLSMLTNWCLFTWFFMKETAGTWQEGMHSLGAQGCVCQYLIHYRVAFFSSLPCPSYAPYCPPNLRAWTHFPSFFFPLPVSDLESKRRGGDAWFGEVSVCAGLGRRMSYIRGKWDTVGSWATQSIKTLNSWWQRHVFYWSYEKVSNAHLASGQKPSLDCNFP